MRRVQPPVVEMGSYTDPLFTQNGGHAVASRYTVEHTFGLTRNDTIFCASDFGWVVGHSFCLYSPLLVGAASVIFEGKRESPSPITLSSVLMIVWQPSCPTLVSSGKSSSSLE